MGIGQIIAGIIFSALAIGVFVISYIQFKEMGYLFYFWASQEERKRMDKHKESKEPYYRQSGFAFMFIGIFCLVFAVYIVTEWIWMYIVENKYLSKAILIHQAHKSELGVDFTAVIFQAPRAAGEIAEV